MRGEARPGLARRGRLGRQGLAWLGEERLGKAGGAWRGETRRGVTRTGTARQARPGLARRRSARNGKARQARLGGARLGLARQGGTTQARSGPARQGVARLREATKIGWRCGGVSRSPDRRWHLVDFQRGDEMVSSILDDRHKTYGFFMDVAAVACDLKAIIRDRRPDLMPDQDEALQMICTKIARIVMGDANHIDSWRDISGYSQLVADRLEGRKR